MLNHWVLYLAAWQDKVPRTHPVCKNFQDKKKPNKPYVNGCALAAQSTQLRMPELEENQLSFMHLYTGEGWWCGCESKEPHCKHWEVHIPRWMCSSSFNTQSSWEKETLGRMWQCPLHLLSQVCAGIDQVHRAWPCHVAESPCSEHQPLSHPQLSCHARIHNSFNGVFSLSPWNSPNTFCMSTRPAIRMQLTLMGLVPLKWLQAQTLG